MKNLILALLFASLVCPASAQGGNKGYERTADKFSVNSIVINERTFNVGDTVTFLSGSGPNSEFVSTKLFVGLEDPFPASIAGKRVIIIKVYHRSDGLNSFDQLVCEYVNKIHIYIDPLLALSKKEIK